MDTANRGEWSELYVLAELLSSGRLYIADENLSKIESLYNEINVVVTSSESSSKTLYQIDKTEIVVVNPDNGRRLQIKRSAIKNKLIDFLQDLKAKSKGDRAFSLVSGSELKQLLHAKKISAISDHKSDLLISSYDPKIKRMLESGYSIKSQLGSASTLFNASQATNMIYQVVGLNTDQIETINAESSCRDRVLKIYEQGGKLIFLHSKNKIFNNNLMMVDSYFPEILAEALIVYYSTEARKLEECINEMNKKGIPGLKMEDTKFFLINNFKKFIFYSALGMVAKSVWDGIATATGGLILVKKDGEIVAYTPNDINLFQDYLLKNTKFDSPDSGRNKYGKIESEGKRYLMSLNFQIRFMK